MAEEVAAEGKPRERDWGWFMGYFSEDLSEVLGIGWDLISSCWVGVWR